MKSARNVVGSNRILQGNIDPIILYGPKHLIENEVRNCILEANGNHILNLGHGVEKDTPEESVLTFVNAAKNNYFN